MSTYVVAWAPAAETDFEELPQGMKARVLARVDALATEPRPPGCKKLAGSDDKWRIRIGDFRAIYSVKDKLLLVLVLRVANRKDAYR